MFVVVGQVRSLLVAVSRQSVQISWILPTGFRLGTLFMLSLPISAEVSVSLVFPAVSVISCAVFNNG